jgi:hypothetical protein
MRAQFSEVKFSSVALAVVAASVLYNERQWGGWSGELLTDDLVECVCLSAKHDGSVGLLQD